jgi:serine protease Do
MNPFGNGNPFEIAPPAPQREMGLGSGFIVDPSGYILTNNHVVKDATRIQVKLPDGPTQYTAKLVGTDPELDLAVLKINVDKRLPALKLGNSDAVQTGDWAIAIGSPFGLEQTMTAGIISAKGRNLNDPGHQLQRFLQTDAAINHGNSGGPLLNIDGQVIGINTEIASSDGNFAGIGFALPINLAVGSYNQIVRHGKVTRGAIGIEFRQQNPALLKAYGASSGVFVQQVDPNGPAAKAGIQPSDIIVDVNGKPIKNGNDLVRVISAAEPGSTAQIKVLRDGKTIEVPVKIGDRNSVIAENGNGVETPNEGEGEAAHARLGISVRNLDQGDRQQLGIVSGGVVVTAVQPGSFADDIGLARGDVLLAINRQPVRSTADVRNIMASAKPGEAIAFKLMRNTGQGWASIYTAGTLPDTQ